MDFGSLREFFSNMRTFRKIGKANSVNVKYLDPSNKLLDLPGAYNPDEDTVTILSLQKQIFLKGKGMYLDNKGKKCIISSYNRACALRPEQEKQDFLTSSNVETILKSGLLNQVLKPNITLGIVGFICGVAFTALAGVTLLGVSMA